MKYIDMRSDTVTQPTEAMRIAMSNAPVGDDVYRDDPTVNELEALAAEMLGKEAALFVPSGTMGNQLGIMAQTGRGDEIIASAHSHILWHEVGGPAVLSGVMTRGLYFEDTMPNAAQIEAAIRPDDIHEPPTTLICLENALSNGLVVPVETMKEIWEMAKRHNLPVHLDGARVFNAAVSLGVDVKEITQYCDTLSACLSKGLCAPVGAVLAGPRSVIERARKWRKLLGGGMRQCGILAAAGLISLKEMTGRLKEDHDNAKYLAEKLGALPGIHTEPEKVQINMVFFSSDNIEGMKTLQAALFEKGIKIGGYSGDKMRLVTNNDVSREDIDKVIEAIGEHLCK